MVARQEANAAGCSCETVPMNRERFLKMGAGALVGAALLGVGAREAEATQAPDYPAGVWEPAYQGNYTGASRERSHPVNRIVVHRYETTPQFAAWWFQDPRANVSAHYLVGRGGRVMQCVRHEDIAYHAGHWPTNERSIGIEHCVGRDRPQNWTDDLYGGSARLAAFCAKKHRIPVDREHIVPHRQVDDRTDCPGKLFDLERYIRLVERHRARL